MKIDDPICKRLIAEYKENKDYLLSKDDLKDLFPKKSNAILDNFENAKVEVFDYIDDSNVRLFITWELPFNLGDKISNLHGAKGVVSKILPDDEMPKLLRKVGNMEPGPLEIIISGFSTIRRGSLGQIFEAWATASGIDLVEGEDYISYVADIYKAQMKDYSKNSIVSYKGEENIIPVGIIDIMRLNHHASIHVSESPVEHLNFNNMLKLGEMEKLNLVSTNSKAILKELSIRSIHKYIGAMKMVDDMQRYRTLPKSPILSLKFAQALKSIGYEIMLDNKPLVISDTSEIFDIDEDFLNELFELA